MKKLQKNFKSSYNTVEVFACDCRCGSQCSCAYCKETWTAQKNADLARMAIKVTVGPEITS